MTAGVVVRYAPSPTGALHLGGLRTALFNFAFARQKKGQFLLRIEDTDQSRTVPGAAEQLMSVLKRCGLQWSNEEVEFQSNRLPLYHAHAKSLLQQRSAYRCFCSQERLEALRQSNRTGAAYDRFCLSLSESEVAAKLEGKEAHTIRMVAPEGGVRVKDSLRGEVYFPLGVPDDQILVKSDGMPTYHLASVVDDHHMGVTHVIRGEEWLSSAPKHVVLYKMFGWKAPEFTHLPLLLNREGAKLSKRHGDVAVQDFLDKGYLPSAIVNFVALLGWTPPTELDPATDEPVSADWSSLTLEDIVGSFALGDVNKSSAVVDIERLNHINSKHLGLILSGSLGEDTKLEMLQRIRTDMTLEESVTNEYLLAVLQALMSRARVIEDFQRLCGHFFTQFIDTSSDPVALVKSEVWHEEAPGMLKTAHDRFVELGDDQWTEENIRLAIKSATKDMCGRDKKQSTFLLPLRWALTGMSVGAPLPLTLALLGKQRVLDRLRSQTAIQ